MDKRLSLALKYYDAKLLDESWAELRELMDESVPSCEAMQLAATVQLENGAFDTVLVIAERLIVLYPDLVDGLVFKGQALMASGRSDEAGLVFMKACEREPSNVDAQFNLGLWHHDAHRLKEAENAYSLALSGRESFVNAWNNLGNVQDESGRFEEARTSFRRAIELQPDYSPAHNNLGASLASQGYFNAAIKSYMRAFELDPQNYAARINLGVAMLEQGDVFASLSVFDSILSVQPNNNCAYHNRLYANIYLEDAPEKLMSEHTTWADSVAIGRPLKVQDPRGDRRIRVGYISPDFRRHSVSFFFEPLLTEQDSSGIEVFCYSDADHPDAVTARLQAYGHYWRVIKGMSDESVHDLILSDHIDILVDLAGHTTGNRLSLFGRRAAPIQVTGLGYPATTGVPNMDYRFCDALTDPEPVSDSWSSETLIRLPEGLHCFQPPRSAADPVFPPVSENGYVTFGSFNKFAKISPLTVTMWAGVLRAMPTARLILKSKALTEEITCERLRSMFSEQGIAIDRLQLMGWESSDDAHLRLYNSIDIALDTFPYNGTATTCEALWMGVPVITLAGRGHAARVGASLLTQLGRDDWIAQSTADYIVGAKRLGSDISGLVEIRRKLRAQMAESSLCDAPRYAKKMETAYRRIWRALCETQS